MNVAKTMSAECKCSPPPKPPYEPKVCEKCRVKLDLTPGDFEYRMEDVKYLIGRGYRDDAKTAVDWIIKKMFK